MKKVLFATGVAVLAIASVVGAQGYSFTTNLTVGSTGPAVVALQTALMAAGHNIPSIASGAASKGYFGSQTQAAVKLYQAARGVPNTGFVGPLTRAALNGGAVVAGPVTAGCPAGYVCTPQAGTPVTPVMTNGTDGSISVTTSSFVSTGSTLKKGETKNVVAVKLQATAGPVTVTRVDAHFSVRPWLFFSTVKLVDSTGAVLATKSVASPADATEITVGTDYLVRFDGLNYVVAPGTNPDLAVSVSVLAATDKITNGMTIYAGIPSGAIRTINGLGLSDSVGGASAFTGTSVPSGAGQTSFTLSSTGSVADISTKISPAAPSAQATVPVSATVATNNVMLGLFSVKSANNSATINALNIQTNTTGGGSGALQTTVFSNVRIVVGSATYGALSYTNAGLATFTNLSIPLAQDVWTDIKVIADVAATSTDVSASSTLLAATINAIDPTYTAATVGGVAMASAAGSNQTSVNTLLTVNSVSISNLSATKLQDVIGVASGPVIAASVAYKFTLTNNSSNSLYVSSNVSTFINGTSTSPANNASSTITTIEPMDAVAGDASGAYIIPSGGGSRTFTVTGLIQKPGGAAASQRLTITSIQYGTSVGTPTGSSITTGITPLTYAVII